MIYEHIDLKSWYKNFDTSCVLRLSMATEPVPSARWTQIRPRSPRGRARIPSLWKWTGPGNPNSRRAFASVDLMCFDHWIMVNNG